jgi:hypothetical protein
MSDKLYDLMKKNIAEGLIARRQGPEAFRRQAEAMFPPEGPPDFVKSATDQERRDAFARVMNELFPSEPVDDEECTSEIEAGYQRVLAAAPQGPEAVRKIIEEISQGTADWIGDAWDLLEARQRGRPWFLYKDKETGGFLHSSPQEGVLRKLLNAEIPPSPPTPEE